MMFNGYNRVWHLLWGIGRPAVVPPSNLDLLQLENNCFILYEDDCFIILE